MSSKPTTVRRRSSRLAVKPSVSYAETAEVPDEILMDRTKAMFETLLEERLAPAKRDLTGVYWRCRKEFLKLFADLPADDVERIAAETFEGKLPLTACGHAITHSYMVADTTKRYNEATAEMNAKVAMEKPVIDSLIAEYNKILVYKAEYQYKLSASTQVLAKHAATLNASINVVRTAEKRSYIRTAIYTLAHTTLTKLNPRMSDLSGKRYAKQVLSILKRGKLSICHVTPRLA